MNSASSTANRLGVNHSSTACGVVDSGRFQNMPQDSVRTSCESKPDFRAAAQCNGKVSGGLHRGTKKARSRELVRNFGLVGRELLLNQSRDWQCS